MPRFYDAPPGWGGAVFPVREGVPPRPRRRVSTPDPTMQIGLVPYVSTVRSALPVCSSRTSRHLASSHIMTDVT